MEIMMIKEFHVRGIPREVGEVVDVSEAEALQYTSGGVAENVTDKKKPLTNKTVKPLNKRTAK
tara:strand:+ start:799 stop:987 length:189 start_codon:yes stop_codon:yes gene_type:complete